MYQIIELTETKPLKASESHRTNVHATNNLSKDVSGKQSPVSVVRKHKEKSCNEETLKSKTLESYAHCLNLFMAVEKPCLYFDKKRQVRHFNNVFRPFELKDFPKVFKGMLADFFSFKTQQNRPNVLLTYNSLFYNSLQNYLVKQQHNSKRKEAELFWNLMHCKVNAAEVPESMIKESYVNHSKILSEQHVTHKNLLLSFGAFIDPYVEEVVKLLPYEEKNVPLVKNHAAFSIPRSQGGTRLIDSNQEMFVHPRDGGRIDPTTFMLSGLPGIGKSLLQAHIKRLMQKMNYDTYERNSGVDHWDGYKHQTVTLIDDFNQEIHSQNNLSTEWQEFITLNSTVDYVLPMAKLEEKGTKFTSPVILYSTNSDLHRFRMSAEKQISNVEAAERRVDQWFNISKVKASRKCIKGLNGQIIQKAISEDHQYPVGTLLCNDKPYDSYKSLAIFITDEIMRTWQKKSSFYKGEFDDRIHHVCFQDKIGSYGYSYPSQPENINHVNVHAIAEPLKVRTITIGDKNLYALKPLQKAMFKALDLYKCMTPCKTPDYLDVLQDLYESTKSRRNFWLSGDYTSATDGLHSDIQQTFTDVLVKKLGDHPLVPYIIADSGVHTLNYPSWTGIKPVQQTNGQLMGSLMSFPILCVANAFTLCYALSTKEKLVSMETVPALFHGDDLLARVTHQDYEKWEQVAKSIGLGLSVGKNYLSKEFGSIDSQLYAQNANGRVEKLDTGKFRCMCPDPSSVEGAVTQLLKRNIKKSTIVTLLKEQLRHTPRSIDVHTNFGGLDPNGRAPESELEHALTYRKYEKVIGIRQLAKIGENYLIDAPKELLNERVSTSYRIVNLSSEETEVNPWTALRKLKKEKPIVNTDLDLLLYKDRSTVVVSQDTYVRLNRRAHTILVSETTTKLDRLYFQALNYLRGKEEQGV
jgi:DNA polymerase III psi subunit